MMSSLVHTYGLFQVSSTDFNGIKPQVNSREQTCHERPHRVSSSYFWEQTLTTLVGCWRIVSKIRQIPPLVAVTPAPAVAISGVIQRSGGAAAGTAP